MGFQVPKRKATSLSKAGYSIGNRKVAIIGAGFVGSTIAYAMALQDVAREIALVDYNTTKANGEALDIRHGIPSLGTADVYTGSYKDCADCDLVIICAGRNRRPGETRLDLASENTLLMRGVTDEVLRYYTRGCILVISNPVDILTYRVNEWMGLPNGAVFGSGCVLDTSRFVATIADYVQIGTGSVSGYVVGEHGDCQVPLWSRVTIGGIPIKDYCAEVGLAWDADVRERIAFRTRSMGGEIIAAKGRTHYGIATCVCHLADAVINQRPVIACVSSTLMGEHGARGVALSVPSVVGASGVQQRIRERWEPNEYRGFFDAVEKMRSKLSELDGRM